MTQTYYLVFDSKRNNYRKFQQTVFGSLFFTNSRSFESRLNTIKWFFAITNRFNKHNDKQGCFQNCNAVIFI